MRRLLSVVAVLGLLACALARPARADLFGGEQTLSIGLGGTNDAGRITSGHYRLGHWVPVHVRLENRTGAPFSGFLSVEENDLDGDKARSIGPPFTLQADNTPRDLWMYYWPRPDDDGHGARTVQVLDESHHAVATLNAPTVHATDPTIGISPEGRDMDDHSQRWVVVLGRSLMGLDQYALAHGGVATVRLTWLTRGGDLPDRALGLDGVDTLIWQADADQCRVSQVPAEYQLKAIHDWVRAGGHLIISTGPLWREAFDPASPLADMLPLAVDLSRPQEGGHEIPDASVIRNWIGRIIPPRGAEIETAPPVKGPFIQVAGHLKPGARVIRGAADAAGSAPLVVTGAYGAGTVTLVTMDMGAEPLKAMTARQRLAFWQKAAGWPGAMVSDADYRAYRDTVAAGGDPLMIDPPRAALDGDVAASIDLSSQTAVRLLMAVLFLAAYWCVAGPASHLVLRHYHVLHWSWWIFGALVIVASGGAVLMVSALRLENYEVKHRTYVMGAVNDGEVSIVGYYGVFAPTNGHVTLAFPPTAGLAYLAPLNAPRYQAVEGYVDPQHYDINDEHAGTIQLPFRNTLRKMQGRWVGTTPATLSAVDVRPVFLKAAGSNPPALAGLSGKLINHTPYPLYDVQILALLDGVPPGEAPIGTASRDSIFDAPNLAPGAAMDLALESRKRAGTLWDYLDRVGRTYAKQAVSLPGELADGAPLTSERQSLDLLNVLLDTRPPGGDRAWNVGGLTDSAARVEFTRQFTRLIDRSQSLRATGLLIVARAGSTTQGVASPIPLKVDNKEIAGTGEILFTWSAVLPQ